ncbi:MAG TPA: hypothetical protein VEH28_08615 [Thermoplasmata archaeon]|nr:hypothetical protein [Thermoplasmata archaeon]
MFLDTNALLLVARTGFPLGPEVDRLLPGARIAIPSTAVAELDRLLGRGVRGARMALELARRYPVTPVPGRGDSAILEGAARQRAWVVTADRELAARLLRTGLPVLVPRDRQRLEPRRGRRRAGASAAVHPAARPARRRQRL